MLRFGSEEEALQHLSDLTGSRVVIASAGTIPSNAPKGVKEVAEKWIESAMKAAEQLIEEDKEEGEEAENTREFWKNRIYVHNDKRNSDDEEFDGEDAWFVSDNYSKVPTLVYYPARDEWYYSSYDKDELLKGGQNDAEANAEAMWVG